MPSQIVKPPGNIFARMWKFVVSWFFHLVPFLIHPTYIHQEFFKRPIKFYETTDRSGEVAVLTGATGSVGKEVLKKLLQSKFHIIIGCRSVSSGEQVITKIRENGLNTGTVKVFQLDLKSLKSVREFASNVLAETTRIDVLINNAAVMFPLYEITEDGYESQFQTNYLSHFLLTKLLLERTKETGKREDKKGFCRIVNVSSGGNFGGKLDFNDLEICKVFSSSKSYCDSKLCQIFQTRYLEKLFQGENEKVSVYALHPGMIPSDLWNNMNICIIIFLRIFKFIMKTAEDGANTVIQHYLQSLRVKVAST